MNKQKGATKATLLLSIAGKIQKGKLDKAAKDVRKAEESTLRGILEYAKDTEWGKSHNYAEILKAKTADELFALWQKNVPPTDYEDIRPLVERHKNGEENILFPGKPMMYATTSGTTKAPKWIPITHEYYNNIYNKMTKVWLYSMIMHRPKVFWGQIVSIVGKSIEGEAPDGTVYGSVSGVTQRDCPQFVKDLYSAPAAVFRIADYKARYYAIMRMGIERDVTLIVTANPSTIVEMQNNVNEFYDSYVNDIEKGTLNESLNIDQDIRDEIQPFLKPNPKRAAELRALKEKHGMVLPKHYWPNMQLLNTWYCGNTHVYLDKFRDSFNPEMLHMEFSYFASECRAGLVMDGKDNTTLFAHMHYFEFVREEDLEKENKEFLQLHQLEEGKRYSIYVTTYAGLYRYDMNDLVECTGHYGTIPTIKLIQKTNGIITITGEKLHESQFIDAVHEAEKITNVKTKFFVGFASVEESRYHFYYEFADESINMETAEKFTGEVDRILKESNIEYAAKRDSFRLKDSATHILQKDSFETYKARCIDMGARDGQFKLNLLMQDEKRHDMFKALVRE
ncbi:MAG: GH3 auxin-responsive promoter family protein [Treponema sp.]|nr:GH3 auxin-responsive promoter family protein [Treponema sp.]